MTKSDLGQFFQQALKTLTSERRFRMSTTRRTFLKKLVGGVGALGLGSVILSQRGWFGFMGPNEAFAQPGQYYELKPGFTFFESYKKGDPPGQLPDYVRRDYKVKDGDEGAVLEKLKQNRNNFPHKPQIIDHNAKPKKTYELNDSAAYITRLLLIDVDTDLLARMYSSRFGGTVEEARRKITDFINAPPQCFIGKGGVNLSMDAPRFGPAKDFTFIWADFSVGSIWTGGVKFPA